MLAIPEGRICYVATCDKCGDVAELDEENVDDARADLVKIGWLEMARDGKGRERWHWHCKTCRPKPSSSSMGPTTPPAPDSDP